MIHRRKIDHDNDALAVRRAPPPPAPPIEVSVQAQGDDSTKKQREARVKALKSQAHTGLCFEQGGTSEGDEEEDENGGGVSRRDESQENRVGQGRIGACSDTNRQGGAAAVSLSRSRSSC